MSIDSKTLKNNLLIKNQTDFNVVRAEMELSKTTEDYQLAMTTKGNAAKQFEALKSQEWYKLLLSGGNC